VRSLASKVRYLIDPDNPYPDRFTGHVRAVLRDGGVREARQDHFRGGRDEPMSSEALEAKFAANCAYGGWDAERMATALAALRALRGAPVVDLRACRDEQRARHA
jgi:2-methylcitrate dehydratase PrpD